MIAERNPLLSSRKRIRLDAGEYGQTGAICSITIAVKDRRPVFGNPEIALAAVDVLRLLSARFGVRIYGYCVMPDHVHLIIEPSDTCDIVTFVGQFKNLTLRRAWSHGVEGSFWQSSFWDHFLRRQEGLKDLVMYVLNNPTRSGLVEHWREYPYSGSFALEL